MRRGRPPYPDILTPRQWEVLELLREGLSNDAIGERLGISRDGAKYHVAEILSKLNLPTREAAAAWTPEAEARPRSRARLAIPGVGGLVHLPFAKAAACVVLAAAVAGLGLLVFAVLATRGDEDSGETSGPLGKLAFVQDGNLWVKELPGGTPRHLTNDGKASTPLWSPSGDWLLMNEAVIRAGDGSSHAAPGCRTWSPSTDELVCTDPSGDWVLVSADGNRGQVISAQSLLSIAPADSKLGTPELSPDRSKLAYAVNGPLDGAGVPAHRLSSLWVADADGANAHPIVESNGSADGGAVMVVGWTPDGTRILFSVALGFSASLAADGVQFYAIQPSGGSPVLLQNGMLRSKTLLGGFSPTGTLAFTAGTGRETWTGKRVALLDVATGTARFLTDANDSAFSPAWSPDASKLAYVSAPDIGSVGGGDVAKAGAAKRKIWLINADGSGRRALTEDAAYRDEWPLWSNDGSQLLIARIDGEGAASVWLVDAGGSGVPAMKVADISRPLGRLDPPLWFGYYGHVGWDQFYDWWQP